MLLLLLLSYGMASAQPSPSSQWKTPMLEVNFVSDTGDNAQMEIDKGFQYADLDYNGRQFHLFFHRGIDLIKKARITEPKTDLLIARGKGSYFWGTARFQFVDGETYKVKKKRNANGYEIIGPNGLLFKVQDYAIVPVKPLTEKDLLAQAFYVFEQIKITQGTPPDVEIYNTYNYPSTSDD